MKVLKLGSRGSRLALIQASRVAGMLRTVGVAVEVVVVKTAGDGASPARLAEMGGKGAFVSDLETMLQSGLLDAAVHSMKDLPTTLADGLAIGATPEREDRRDVMVASAGTRLNELPAGSRIGTSSLRRRAQLLRLRQGMSVVEMSGNVDTRLRRLDSGEYDAIILAAAGLVRLGQGTRITEYLPVDAFMPAPCQGAIALEVREGDSTVLAAGAAIDDAQTRHETTAERSFAKALGSDCDVPAAASAVLAGDSLKINGRLLTPDGKVLAESSVSGRPEEAAALGSALAIDILDKGGRDILAGAAVA
jgi:hydroxymethylbilane synthase